MNGKKAVPYGSKSPSTVVAGKKRIRNTLLYVWLSPDEIKALQKDYADLWGRFPNCWRGFRGFGVQPQQAFSQGKNGANEC